MEITDIFSEYTSKIAQLHLYQRAVQENAKRELQELEKYEKSIAENPTLKEFSSSYDSMYFRSAKDGEHRNFGYKKSSIDDRKKAVILHKNKQYQWLLAEAYEEFEDFIENAYAFVGYIDKNFWPLSDFGNISLADLQCKKFEWFAKQAKAKRDIPQSIINKFRMAFPELATLEATNALNKNLRLAIVLIEHLRHLIVHKGGVVTDKEKFIEIVLQKSGLYNNGKYESTHVDFIKSFFGGVAYENTIILLEVRIRHEIPLNFHINIFEMLSGYLVAYAHIIAECLFAYPKNT